MAESNFNPYAGSPAGAQGIAQFMPSTAAAYGLRNPFDPEEAIDAQAHLMSDLIHQFGSPQLALAAYNAGPAPVEACDCIPDYPRDPGLCQPHPRPARRRRRPRRADLRSEARRVDARHCLQMYGKTVSGVPIAEG